MNARYVIVLEREPIIANDMVEEVAALDPGAHVRLATSIDGALAAVQEVDTVDLLIVSQRSTAFATDARFPRLARAARSLMLIGDESQDWLRDYVDVHVARAPFTSSSLRTDLMSVTVAGAPLFPQRSPE